MTGTASAQKKSLSAPDEVRTIDKGRLEIVTLGGKEFTRVVFEPGWRWSESVKPIAQTDSCELPHAVYVVEGSLHVQMDDGLGIDLESGDVAVIAPGHDGWVTSDVACVMYDFGDEDSDFAKPPAG